MFPHAGCPWEQGEHRDPATPKSRGTTLGREGASMLALIQLLYPGWGRAAGAGAGDAPGEEQDWPEEGRHCCCPSLPKHIHSARGCLLLVLLGTEINVSVILGWSSSSHSDHPKVATTALSPAVSQQQQEVAEGGVEVLLPGVESLRTPRGILLIPEHWKMFPSPAHVPV